MKLLKILPVIMIVCVVFTSVFAIEFSGSGADLTYGQSGSSEIKTVSKRTWATIALIIQILAVAAVVFAGLRYMFASADQRADLKKSMGILTIGAILVFVTVPVLQLVASTVKDVSSGSGSSINNGSAAIYNSNFTARHNIVDSTLNPGEKTVIIELTVAQHLVTKEHKDIDLDGAYLDKFFKAYRVGDKNVFVGTDDTKIHSFWEGCQKDMYITTDAFHIRW